MPKKINLAIRNSGYGFSQHIAILTKLLTRAGYKVSSGGDRANEIRTRIFFFLQRHFPRFLRWLQDLYQRYTRSISEKARANKRRPVAYDLTLHTMHDHLEQLVMARQNVFIPHQEWFEPEWFPILDSFDAVLCLTEYAQAIFEHKHPNTHFIGFTSEDAYRPDVEKEFPGFFHLAGLSPYKGTHAVIRAWERHPEWPLLTVVQHPSRAIDTNADNVRYIVEDYLDGQVVRQMQNHFGVHLCTSESEGFGHYIVEAMSAKAVVVTLDAPPMNELIQPDRGYLVHYKGKKQVGVGDNFFTDDAHFDEVITDILATDEATLRRIGGKARDWYLDNQAAFETRILKEIDRLLNGQ